MTHCKSFVHLIPQLDDIIDSLFLTAYPSKDPQLLQFSLDIMTILTQAQIYKNPKALFLVMHFIRKSPGQNWTFSLWQSLVKILTTFFTETKHSENQRDILAFKEVSKALHFLMNKSKEIPAELKSQLQLFMDADSLQINHG